MITITLDEAEKRFGPLLEPRTGTYRMFEVEDGEWRPHFQDAGVVGYQLYPPRSGDSPKTRWRPKSRPGLTQRDRKP
ncbi:hypothetical protein [Lichenihabitans psoromatis]|uniref:hypothetical protein n=1 Tax=Lichenihabitans psoromatis TaxID=2528642 RepID=UPI00103595A3|nr:hypothetical protein [Lichenihabitans psoromatis]